MRWVSRVLTPVLTIAMTIISSYATAGMIGGAIPANAAWRAPDTGIRIFVESNGVHTGIVMPKIAAGVDWRGVARARDLADPRYAGFDHVAIGWGEKTFYLETPSWADVRPATIAAAAIGSDRTLMHVEHVPMPRVGDDVRAIMVSPDQYRRLAAFVAAGFAPGGRQYPGYDRYDAFYDARGHYDAIETCNSWVGDALRQAGIRVGAWTPFPATVMGWF